MFVRKKLLFGYNRFVCPVRFSNCFIPWWFVFTSRSSFINITKEPLVFSFDYTYGWF